METGNGAVQRNARRSPRHQGLGQTKARLLGAHEAHSLERRSGPG